MFLNDDELARLTGRRQKKRQIAQLRAMGLPFFINAAGAPVVARSAVEGAAPRPDERPSPRQAWQPALVKLAGGR
jgi:hypothetical protein